ncbi:glycosyltransferase family 2 protein [Rhodoligotrophos defluvii]|uniref:glycosyltransferase family 2 protein n=1 Tax=Rhodoligotrophos defluvii TaxID=2561934 RepID=UPI0010C95A99|nr:glycosyltransferase family A protein [Rhodoligotrophos defluvii]
MVDQQRQISVSVLMTARDVSEFIAESLQSILRQTHQDFEFLVVDDQSTDQTADVIRRIAAEDDRVVLLCSSKQGRIPALNTALAAARGQYVAIMDADDLADPSRLALQKAYLDEHPNVVAVGSALTYIGPDETAPISLSGRKVTIKPEQPRTMLGGWNARPLAIVHSTAMMRREAVIAAGGYRPALIHQEDTDLFLRLEEMGEVRNLPQILHYYRQHSANTGRRHLVAQCAAWRLALALAERRRSGQTDPAFFHGRAAVWTHLALRAPGAALRLALWVTVEVMRRMRKRRRLFQMLNRCSRVEAELAREGLA